MATQTKKNAPGKRRSNKRTVRKKPFPSQGLLRVFMLLFVATVIGFAGFFYGYEVGKQEHLVALNAEKQHSFELKNALKKAQELTASHEYEKAPPQPPERIKHASPSGLQSNRLAKPKLAIIIDDVSFAHDVRNVKALGLQLTMSFLPPSKRHPDSAKLAAKEPFYMVHLPMEAMSYASEEPDTLHVGDDAAAIEARVRQIKMLFPKVTFINNHTGSKFTADKEEMEKLIYALDREGITFVDSRTTAKTAVPGLMKSLHRPYISRDVFLDDDPALNAVKKQVRRAVNIAKKYGSAIAIGHPHKQTLQALAESKDILSEVDLVRIDTLVAYESND